MSKKKDDLPKPFEVLKEFTKKYPNVWNLCDEFHDDNGKNGLPEWNPVCDLPIAAGIAIMTDYHKKGFEVNHAEFPELCSCLYSWRKYKEIYSFDNDLAELLMNQADESEEDMLLPIDTLLSLPYPCIYITFSDVSNLDLYGFWVWFEYDVNVNELEFRFLLHKKNNTFENLMFHIQEGFTFKDAVDRTIEIILENIGNNQQLKGQYAEYGISVDKFNDVTADEVIEFKEIFIGKILSLLQLVLYICADNKEYEPNPTITRRKDIDLKNNKPKDVFREIQKWDVGYRYGNTIRRYKNKIETANGIESQSVGNGSKKRPHSRRGHWHNYWIGSDKQGTRKLILKWIAPMFINGDFDDDVPTIHKVKE